MSRSYITCTDYVCKLCGSSAQSKITTLFVAGKPVSGTEPLIIVLFNTAHLQKHLFENHVFFSSLSS